MQSLSKSVFGDREAKRVHGAAWRTATVFGVILPTSAAGRKVSVEWEDVVNNLGQVSKVVAVQASQQFAMLLLLLRALQHQKAEHFFRIRSKSTIEGGARGG